MRAILNSLNRWEYRLLFLKDNTAWRLFRPFYYALKGKIFKDLHDLRPNPESTAFFTRNAARVEAVANMMEDARSKKVFLGMVKFRQSRRREDFPGHEWRSAYFIREMPPREGEVFIDCGAFIGDTLEAFIKRCPRYKHITAFEPDAQNFKRLEAGHAGRPGVTLVNAGVGARDGFARFQGDCSVASKIADAHGKTVEIPVRAIDNLPLEKITFIKMDIEGAEFDALKGAEKTILRDKPKLAVSIYHSDEDMLRIAEHIRGLVPEYRLHARQHNSHPAETETILYAHV